MTCVHAQMQDGRIDVLGSLPFEVACLIVERVDVVSTIALTRVSAGMRRLVAASGAYDPERHVHVGDVDVRVEADMKALCGVRVLVGSLQIDPTWSGDGLKHLSALEVVTLGVNFSHCTALTDTAGLASLTTIGVGMSFFRCTALTSTAGLDGLDALVSVGGRAHERRWTHGLWLLH